MQLASLPESTCHQLAIDLGYLCDVLDDLSMVEVRSLAVFLLTCHTPFTHETEGYHREVQTSFLLMFQVTQPLQDVKELLVCSPENFASTSKGKPMQIVHTIKTSRKIS